MFSAKGFALIVTGESIETFPTVNIGFQLSKESIEVLMEKKVKDRSIVDTGSIVGVIGAFMEVRDHASPEETYYLHVGKTDNDQKSFLEEVMLSEK